MEASYTTLAQVAKAFADPHRLLILERLAQGACTVEVLGERSAIPLANLSHHLQVLKRAGLVVATRRGRLIQYALATAPVMEAWTALSALDRRLHHDPVFEGLGAEPGPRLPRDEALELVREGRAILLDTRPREEYDAGHIRGAVHADPGTLPQVLASLPPGQILITYCRGPYCQLAIKAALDLDRSGHPARVLEDGYPQWVSQGLPVDGA